MAKFIGETGLVYLWAKIKAWVSAYAKITESSGTKSLTVGNTTATIATKTSELTNDSDFITSADIPEGAAASSTTPLMDGTADVGSETRFARGDHRHPTDTSRQAAITSSNKLSADLISDGTTNKTVTATEKNTWNSKGTYSKPSGGIPKSDLASAVQTSLENADSALQSETDPVFSASAAAGITAEDISNWNNGESNVVKSVNTTAGTSGINLSLSSAGALDVTISSGSVASGNSNFVTGGTVYSTTSTLAPKASPAFTGTPTAPTATAGTNTTQVATTEFVQTAVSGATSDITGQKGQANGIASLDSSGKVPSSQLPSYVDDVIEAYIRSGQTALSSTWLATGSATGTVITPEAGKIYVLMNSDSTYTANSEFRWGGTTYVRLNDSGCTEMTTAEMDTATNNWT